MKLQTQIPLQKAQNPIDYNSQLLLIGSCFSENMGARLAYFKFQTLQNPFGILFHPLAIENLISRAVTKQYYTQDEVFFLNERWHCFDAHSSLSDVSKEQLLENLNAQLARTEEQLQKATQIIITLGTAWVYRNKESKKTVANCHKVSQKQFDKALLSVDEITTSLKRIAHQVATVNKSALVIYTISPVRHLKDGFVENQRSKAHLHTALHAAVQTSDICARSYYFPAYEIMMDELRDYRFYDTDMVHPSELAIAYIWERFVLVWLASSTTEIMKMVAAVQKGLQHKPFNAHSEASKSFRLAVEVKIEELRKMHSHIRFHNRFNTLGS